MSYHSVSMALIVRDWAKARALLAAGDVVDATDDAGNTPLIIASSGRDIEGVKFLLGEGANVNATNWHGKTSLVLAIYNNDLKVAEALLKAGANVDTTVKGDFTLLLWVAKQNDFDKNYLKMAKVLLKAEANVDAADIHGNTPLLWAAHKDNLEMVKVLLAAGANVDATSNNGNTPLLRAANNDNLEMVKVLLAAGANVDATSNNGSTPLLRAANNDNLEMVNVLLEIGGMAKVLGEVGTNVDAADIHGYTPLMFAALHSNLGMAEALLQNNLHINASNNRSETALDIALKRNCAPYVAVLLVSRGADFRNAPLFKALIANNTQTFFSDPQLLKNSCEALVASCLDKYASQLMEEPMQPFFSTLLKEVDIHTCLSPKHYQRFLEHYFLKYEGSWHEVLGISKEATTEQIKARYQQIVKALAAHQTKMENSNEFDLEFSESIMAKLNEALDQRKNGGHILTSDIKSPADMT